MMHQLKFLQPLALFLSLLLLLCSLASCTNPSDKTAESSASTTDSGAGDSENADSTGEELGGTDADEPLSCLAYVYDEEHPADYSAMNAAWKSLSKTPALSEEELALPTKELIDRIFTLENAYVFWAVSTSSDRYILSNGTYCFDTFGRSPYCFYDAYRDMRSFNGFAELETRPDAAKQLLEKYKTSLTDDAFGILQKNYGRNSYGYLPLMTQCLEVVLSQKLYYDQLSDGEVAELYATLEKFYAPEADRGRLPKLYHDQSFRFYTHFTKEGFPGSMYGEVDLRNGEPIRICDIQGTTPHYSDTESEDAAVAFTQAANASYTVSPSSDGTFFYKKGNGAEGALTYQIRFTEESYAVFYCPDDPTAEEYTLVLGDFGAPVLVPYEG